MNNRANPDDVEGDIADDPFLSAVSADLESVNKRNDNKLLVILLLLIPTAFIYERSGVKNAWLDAAGIGLIVSSIAYTIYTVAAQKQRIASKYGLVCHVCGYKPKASMVLSAAMTQHCTKCGATLNG